MFYLYVLYNASACMQYTNITDDLLDMYLIWKEHKGQLGLQTSEERILENLVYVQNLDLAL